MPGPGGSTPGGIYPPPGEVSGPGGIPACTEADPPSPVNRILETCY